MMHYCVCQVRICMGIFCPFISAKQLEIVKFYRIYNLPISGDYLNLLIWSFIFEDFVSNKFEQFTYPTCSELAKD